MKPELKNQNHFQTMNTTPHQPSHFSDQFPVPTPLHPSSYIPWPSLQTFSSTSTEQLAAPPSSPFSSSWPYLLDSTYCTNIGQVPEPIYGYPQSSYFMEQSAQAQAQGSQLNHKEALIINQLALGTSSNTSEIQQGAKIVRNKKPVQKEPGRLSKDQVYRRKIKEKEQLKDLDIKNLLQKLADKDKQLADKDKQLADKDKQLAYKEGQIFQLTSENERLRNEILASINYKYNNKLLMR